MFLQHVLVSQKLGNYLITFAAELNMNFFFFRMGLSPCRSFTVTLVLSLCSSSEPSALNNP